MRGRGTAALAYEITVRFRRPRPHEHAPALPGHKVIVAIADLPDGPEECAWLVPERAAKQALNPRVRGPARALAEGVVPPGWQRI